VHGAFSTELDDMLKEYDMKRASVEINYDAQWSHNAVWNRRYIEPKTSSVHWGARNAPPQTCTLAQRVLEEWERTLCENKAVAILEQMQAGRPALIEKDGGEFFFPSNAFMASARSFNMFYCMSQIGVNWLIKSCISRLL